IIMISDYCRKYRISKGATLIELTKGSQIKTLSAFEMGRSSNIKHLIPYIELSISLDDKDNFMDGLANSIRNNNG
ncbi:hypothetical protein ACP3XM_24705, partial [Salmonella enterica]